MPRSSVRQSSPHSSQEAVAAQLQRVAELAVVVEFAVEDYSDIALFIPDGLMAAG
jgi:hypothetical protein